MNLPRQTFLLTGVLALATGLVLSAKPAATPKKQVIRPILVQAAGFAESQRVMALPDRLPSESTIAKSPGSAMPQQNRTVIRRRDSRVKPSANATRSAKRSANPNSLQQTQALPTPVVSFEGISNADTVAIGISTLPPDATGAAGPNHYVQAVNSAFRVWNKSGAPLTNTKSLGDLFAPLGGACGGSIDGSPTVLYDQLADRWLISEVCSSPNPAHQLIAVSKTGDPTGSYYLYDFVMANSKSNDDPHFGLWSDGYYMTDNQFNNDAFAQSGVFAFDRSKMLIGDATASFIYFDTALLFPPSSGNNGPDGISGMLPACLDGLTPPSAGVPCPFAFFQADEFSDPGDQLRIFDFHADFSTPSHSTFAEHTGSPLLVAAFDPGPDPDSPDVIPQPPPATASNYLNAVNDRLMFRLAYRNFGTSEKLLLNHTVNAATNPSYQAGVRFYQLTRSSSSAAFSIVEQQTWAGPLGDTANRWIGSGAMNFQGDIAIGYNVSSTSVYPSIRYAAKLNTDPSGSGLAQGEQTIIAGGGVQTDLSGLWGAYSDMTIDPSDDCSFWYTQEYYSATSGTGWHTRIAKLVPGTSAVSPRGTISGTITDCLSGTPIPNAFVQIGNYSRATLGNGTYSATAAPGTYNATVSAPGYTSASISGLVVSNGGNVNYSACLSGIIPGTATVTSDGCNSDHRIDPNETVTVSLQIKNTGTVATSNLVATLQATGGVTSPGGPQTYGVIAANGGAISKSFTFTAGNISCGTTLVATLQLQDGATNLGTISYNFATGVLNIALSQNFDGVTPPALPAGWAASNAAGPAPLWTSSASAPDSSPNDAFVDDPITLSDKYLDTPSIGITSTAAQVTFRNNYNLESTFDGGVLEISAPNINGGVFTDITDPAVGGSFTSGGYTDTISSGQGSPIAGRLAWTGSSGGYITTVANLGPNLVGQTIKLRFRMASDTDTGGGGWRIDTVQVTNGLLCCGPTIIASPPPTVTAESYSPANAAPDPGEIVTVTFPLLNVGGGNTSNLMATLLSSGGVTNPSGAQSYGVVAPGGGSVSRPFSFLATGTCGSNITATLALIDGANNLGTVTFTMKLGGSGTATTSFSNTSSMTIPGSGSGSSTGAPASVYPSNVVVSGLSGTISKTTVNLNGLNHTFPSDVDMLLVAPGGQNLVILSKVIGSADWVNINYTLDDSAAAIIPSSAAPASGTFRPTDYRAGNVFPPSAPQISYNKSATAGTATLASIFNGASPNGTWSLYVVDDSSGDTGSMTGGWTLNLTTSATTCVNGPPVFVNGPPPSTVIVGTPYTFTYSASGNPSPSFGLTGGAFPPGLSLSSGGVLSGTATSGGSGTFSNISVTATNGVAPNATQTFALNTVTRATNYIFGFGLTGADAIFTADPDHDGLPNLLEYALGLNPTVASLTGLPVITLKDYSGTKYLSITFNRSALATDLTYTVQVSTDLANWTDLTTSVGGAPAGGPGFVQETGSAPGFTVEARDTTAYNPNSPGQHRFMRLQVSSP